MIEARWKDVETKEKSILQSLMSQPCVKRAYSLVQRILLILTVALRLGSPSQIFDLFDSEYYSPVS